MCLGHYLHLRWCRLQLNDHLFLLTLLIFFGFIVAHCLVLCVVYVGVRSGRLGNFVRHPMSLNLSRLGSMVVLYAHITLLHWTWKIFGAVFPPIVLARSCLPSSLLGLASLRFGAIFHLLHLCVSPFLLSPAFSTDALSPMSSNWVSFNPGNPTEPNVVK